MRWTIVRPVRPASGYTPWRKWFAWLPVKTGINQRVWLEIVERRGWCRVEEWGTYYLDWEYRDRQKERKEG